MNDKILLIIIIVLGIALTISIIVNIILYNSLKSSNQQLSWYNMSSRY